MTASASLLEPVPLRKLSPPEPSPVLARPRLFTLLDEARSCPVIWVVGPPGSHVLLISRYLPPRHAAVGEKRRCALLDWEDLRLTKDEAAAIAQLHGPDLDSKRILQPIIETMADWPAGILLCIAFPPRRYAD